MSSPQAMSSTWDKVWMPEVHPIVGTRGDHESGMQKQCSVHESHREVNSGRPPLVRSSQHHRRRPCTPLGRFSPSAASSTDTANGRSTAAIVQPMTPQPMSSSPLVFPCQLNPSDLPVESVMRLASQLTPIASQASKGGTRLLQPRRAIKASALTLFSPPLTTSTLQSSSRTEKQGQVGLFLRLRQSALSQKLCRCPTSLVKPLPIKCTPELLSSSWLRCDAQSSDALQERSNPSIAAMHRRWRACSRRRLATSRQVLTTHRLAVVCLI